MDKFKMKVEDFGLERAKTLAEVIEKVVIMPKEQEVRIGMIGPKRVIIFGSIDDIKRLSTEMQLTDLGPGVHEYIRVLSSEKIREKALKMAIEEKAKLDRLNNLKESIEADIKSVEKMIERDTYKSVSDAQHNFLLSQQSWRNKPKHKR